MSVSRAADADEREADRAADALVNGRPDPLFAGKIPSARVHDDGAAHAAAAALNARAFAKGSDIYLGESALTSAANGGDRLLAHELAHVAQDRGEGSRIRRQELFTPADPSQLMCTADTEPLMCEAQPTAGMSDSGTLDQRVAAFKEWVKQVAIQRLMGNRANLEAWAALVRERLPDDLIAAAGLAQSGGYRAYAELQDIRNPMTREILAYQAAGRYRACTGCHLLTHASSWGAEQTQMGPEWMTPNERRAEARGAGLPGAIPATDRSLIEAWLRGQADTTPLTQLPPLTQVPPLRSAGGAGYVPPRGSAEASLMTALPDPSRVPALMEQARPILEALGPQGYRVLPQHILDDIHTGSIADVKRETLETIVERREDYLELIGMIRSGEVGWEKFAPVISDLLPLAAPDVRQAIQDEMDSNAFWNTVESVVIGILTVAALLLTIFPPTTALGLAAFGALEIGLATYAIATGPEMIRTGHAFSLGTGANDVFTREQQDSGGMMMLTGFLGIALAPLGFLGGASRMATGFGRMSAAARTGAGLLRVGEAVQHGEYVVTLLEDGALMATSTRRPDLLIIVRGNTATLYQSMGPGGLRVVGSQSLSEFAQATEAAQQGTAVLGSGRATPLLTAGSGTDEYANFLRMLEEEGGAAGAVRSGEPVTMQPHAGAGQARQTVGVTGEHQSAHGLPQSVGRGVPGYNPEVALTTLQQRAVHRGMDAAWKQAFQALRRGGRTTASGQEIYDAVANSFRNAPGLAPGVGDTLALRLADEMFVEFGMSATTQYTLPYPNIHP